MHENIDNCYIDLRVKSKLSRYDKQEDLHSYNHGKLKFYMYTCWYSQASSRSRLFAAG